MVHEPYVPMINWRWRILGISQRVQFLGLGVNADILFASIEKWSHDFSRTLRHPQCLHLPVGSNLPDMRDSGEAERARIGIARQDLAVAAFGTGHPARLTGYIVRAVNDLVQIGQHSARKIWLLNLGAGAAGLSNLDPRVRVHAPGVLPGARLARQIAAADIFLAPFVDGISTRRGSLMAALQHGLAVVGTDGPLTDPIFRRPPVAVRLVPVGRPDLFSTAVHDLADSTDDRAALGVAARQLYQDCFDWPVLADRLVDAVDAVGSGRTALDAAGH